MSDPEPKNDVLWFEIARFMYSGLAAYVIVVAIAFVRDFSRSSKIRASPNPYTSALVRWYQHFSSHYRDTHVFYYVEFLRLTTNLVICSLYVLGTYQQNVPAFISIVYRVFGAIFLFDLLVHLFIAESAISTVFSFIYLIDVFSFPSLVLANGPDEYLNFAFLRAIAAYCTYTRLERRMFVHIFSQNRLLVKLCFKTLTLFYVLAAIIQMLEIPGDLLSVQFRDRWSEYGEWNFMNSAYFIIVTLSTVGYGDFSPQTVQGRIYALFIIIIGIIVFSSVVSDLVEQANRDRGSGYFIKNSRTRHVIVTGNPDLNDIVQFITEFYSDSRQSNITAKVVVLVETPAWSDIEWFQYIARNQFLQSRLQFIMGSARNSNDLHRARIDTADAVFILSSPANGKKPSLQDTRTVITILAIRNVRNDIQVYAQTLLEDSNLQTHVALSTSSSDAKVSSSDDRNDTNKAKYARYPGLFNMVISSEYQDLPRVHQPNGRRLREDILDQHNQQKQRINIHEVADSQTEALKQSQHVCLQEIQMALISGNIKANGVATLLSNMYLDVQVPKLTKEDPGWLFEYLMGASTCLTYTIVPEELDGVCVKDIANDMFHFGLILIATSDPTNVHPLLVLNTNITFRGGDLAMIMSYHERMYIAGAFYLVALRYARGEMQYAQLPGHDPGTSVSGEDRYSGAFSGVLDSKMSAISPSSPSATPASKKRTTPPFLQTPPASQSWVRPSMSHMMANVSGDDLDALLDGDDHDIDSRSAHFPESRSSEKISDKNSSESYIPDGLRGHVIVSLEGEAPLENLPLLLRNLWHKDNRRALRKQKRAVIVVVHPSISDDVRKRFSRFERVSLFFVEGSPASRATWRRAKLSTATAVATVADITQPSNLSDSRTIFTLLTLDVSTASDQNLFICSELIDEKSLEYLREPTHPRRRGAALGEPSDRPTSAYTEPPSSQNIASSAPPKESHSEPHSDGEIDAVKGKHKKGKSRTITFETGQNEMSEGDQDMEPETTRSRRFGHGEGEQRKEGKERKESREGKEGSISGGAFARLASKALPTRSKMLSKMTSTKPPVSVVSAEAKSIIAGLGPEAGATGSLPDGADPNNRPGAALARRSTLFSRSRYASGELLVQSSALSLLAREYIEPGFVKFFTNILGTDVSHPGMKIRLVRIPKALFDPGRGYTCKEGRPLIRYNTVVHILIGLGVTPLGLYRSGSAPVLIPWKMRRKRGAAIMGELEPMLEKVARESDAFHTGGTKMFGRSVKNLVNKVRDIDPAKQREKRGRDEIHGNVQNLFSLGTDSDDEEEDSSEIDGDEQSKRNEPISRRSQRVTPPDTSDHVNDDGDKFEDGVGTDERQGRHKKPSGRWGLGIFKRSSHEDTGGGILQGWRSSREREPHAHKFHYNTEPELGVPGRAKYAERPLAENLLPYVYTLPEPNTWCAETDGVYILCDPSYDLPRKWTETANEVGNEECQDAENSKS